MHRLPVVVCAINAGANHGGEGPAYSCLMTARLMHHYKYRMTVGAFTLLHTFDPAP